MKIVISRVQPETPGDFIILIIVGILLLLAYNHARVYQDKELNPKPDTSFVNHSQIPDSLNYR